MTAGGQPRLFRVIISERNAEGDGAEGREEMRRLDCSDYDRMIPDFLEDRLTMRELAAFLRHTERCEACRDEMSTQFLVSRGLEILETDRIFDLRKELSDLIELRSTQLRARRNLFTAAAILETGALTAAAAAVITLLR